MKSGNPTSITQLLWNVLGESVITRSKHANVFFRLMKFRILLIFIVFRKTDKTRCPIWLCRLNVVKCYFDEGIRTAQKPLLLLKLNSEKKSSMDLSFHTMNLQGVPSFTYAVIVTPYKFWLNEFICPSLLTFLDNKESFNLVSET